MNRVVEEVEGTQSSFFEADRCINSRKEESLQQL